MKRLHRCDTPQPNFWNGFMKFPTPSRNRRRGSILPLVFGGITTLLMATALAVDYSLLLSDKNQLQRACDSAALAGAAYLQRSNNPTTNQTEARNQALLIAKQNYLTPTEMTAESITFPGENNTKIRVVASRARPLFFARVLGIVKGNVGASATAAVTPGAATPVPIAITKVSKDSYQNTRTPHIFTLSRPQDTAFKTNYAGLTPYDPFTLFDLRGGSSSPEFMERQLAGDLTSPVNPQIGDLLTTMRPSLGTLAANFKDAISLRLQKAAGVPWLDPPSSLLPASSAWQLVGTRYNDVLTGNIAPKNPRIVRFVVLNELNAPANGGDDVPIVDFAPAYIHSVQDAPGGGLTFTATFLPAGTGDGSGSIALVE